LFVAPSKLETAAERTRVKGLHREASSGKRWSRGNCSSSWSEQELRTISLIWECWNGL